MISSATVSRRSFLTGAAALTGAIAVAGSYRSAVAAQAAADIEWDYEADVVVLGAGGAGLVAANKSLEDGSSVILIEANWDCGGHSAVSEGNMHSGAGTEQQKKYGIEDSTDLYYTDHTYGGMVVTRLNESEHVRAIADNMVEAYEFIQAKGVVVKDQAPTYSGASARDPESDGTGSNDDSVPRQTVPDSSSGEWESYRGKDEAGIYLTRPLEKSAREAGGQFLMNYHMDEIIREGGNSGRVLGVRATYTPHTMPGETEPLDHLMHDGDIECTKESIFVKANKGVIVCTGGSTGNLTLRMAFDPRLGPELDGLGGMPFSDQDGSGELAALAVGASLGDMANYSQQGGGQVCMCARVGCRYGYGSGFSPKSKVWPLVVANGVSIDFDNMVFVNMLGKRFSNEDLGAKPAKGGTVGGKTGTTTGSLYKYNDQTWEWFDAAFSSVVIDDPNVDGDAVRYGGPIWAIFDQATCDAHDWGELEQGTVDYDNGYCFKADTLEELAEKVVNKYYEDVKMDPATLVETITNWNSYVDAGEDPEFGVKTHLVGKVETAPFYCAWSTPCMHDTHAGLRVNSVMQVLDTLGEPIQGLYCAGESCSGMRIHGHGRVLTAGYIAGRSAAADEQGPAAKGAPSRGDAITTEMSVYGVVPEETDEAVAIDVATLPDGTYEGTSPSGQNGEVAVAVTIAGGQITAVEVTKEGETPEIGHAALPTLVEEAIAAQSAQVEAVSGATVTSNAFMEAMNTALSKAVK